MPQLSPLSDICWLLLVCLLDGLTTSSYTIASQDFSTEDIQPSMSYNVLVPPATTIPTRSPTISESTAPYAVTDATDSSQTPDKKFFLPATTLFSVSGGDVTSPPMSDATLFSTSREDVTSLPKANTTLAASAASIEALDFSGSTYLLLGEDLQLTCKLPDNYQGIYSARNISFKHSFPFQPQSNSTCLPDSSLHVINETAAKLIIDHVTFLDIGQYTCFAGDTSCRVGFHSTAPVLFGFVNDVNIEYPPQNVTHLQCVVYNWDESMTCTWRHPVDYKDWSNINVTLVYSKTSLDPNIMCPNQTKTGCYWSEVDETFYTVQVLVTNTPKQQTASVTLGYNAIKSVKPAPIENLSILPIDRPGCLIISWTHPMNHRNKVYRIQHKAPDEDNFTVLIDNLRDNSYRWCDYLPYTHHNFSIQCLPADPYAGNFSDPVFKDVWTPMAAPDLGPAAINGSFTSTQCVDGRRSVTLVWKAVEPAAQNGPISGFLITSGPDNLTSTNGSEFSATVSLTCDPVPVTMFACNPEGLSVSPTTLFISTATVSADVKNSFVVEIKSTGVQASWEEAEEVKGEVDYTIFWCRGQPEQSCEEEIYWMEVPAGHTKFNVPVDSSQAEEYIYGISAKKAKTGIASSIFWTLCLFMRYPSQLPPVSNMNIKSLEEGVYITWSRDSCSYKDKVRYTSFVVKWCRTNACNEPSQISNDTVSVTQSTYIVSSLPAGVNYSFTVQPVSFNTPGREFDPWKVAVLSAKDPADSQMSLAAVLGGIASGVVVLTVVIFVCRYCQMRRKKIKKFRDTSILNFSDITVPELGHSFSELTTAAAQDEQKNRLVRPNSDSSPYSDGSYPGRGCGSANGYNQSISVESEVCNNVQDQETGGLEHDSASENMQDHDSRRSDQGFTADPKNTLHQNLLSSDNVSRTESPENNYIRLTEVSNSIEDQTSIQSEADSTSTGPGYMAHLSLESLDESPQTELLSNSVSRISGNILQLCNNVGDHKSTQPETNSQCMPHVSLVSSEETSNTESPLNSYSRCTGNAPEGSSNPEVSNHCEDHTIRQSEDTSMLTDLGYIPLDEFQSSDKESLTESPSHSYSRVNTNLPEVGDSPDVNDKTKDDTSRQSEDGSISTELCQEFLSSDRHEYTRPPSESYSRVIGNESEVHNNDHMPRQSEEDSALTDPRYVPHHRSLFNFPSMVTENEPEVCNNVEDPTSRQSEEDPTSRQLEEDTTDPGYMLHSSFLSSRTVNVGSLGDSAPSAILNTVPGDINMSVLSTNALYGDYNKEAETHEGQLSILTSVLLGDDVMTGDKSLEETLV